MELGVNNRRARLRGFVLGLSAVLVLLLAAALLMPGSDDVQPVMIRSISLPETVPAGTIVQIDLTAEEQFGIAEVVVSNAYGRLAFTVPVSSGSARLNLPSALSQQAGEATVTSGGVSESLTITPGEVAEVVAPLVGPRTIVADSRDTTLAVVLPVDQYGNQVEDGTDVAIEWQQPASPGETEVVIIEDTDTENGMAFALVQSGTVAGPTTIRTIATTTSGREVNGAVVRIDEVPGVATEIELVPAHTAGMADGRSLIALETSRLVDAFGNELADGTQGQFVFDGPAGRGVLPGTVQNGIVRVELVAPDSSGTLTGRLELQGQRSNEVSIDFASAIAGFDAELEAIGTDVILRVTRALDPNGAFVADGTEVQWGGYSSQIRHGGAEIRLPVSLIPDAIPSVQILGREQLPTGSFS